MASPVPQPQIPRTESTSIAPKRILIADDNAVVRAVVRVLIETRKGVEICGEAVNGLDLIQQAKDLKPDLILLDFRMPRLSGLEAASIIKKELPRVRIILFTMYESEISQTMATAAHVDLVLSKPEGLDKLLESIPTLLELDPAAQASETAT